MEIADFMNSAREKILKEWQTGTLERGIGKKNHRFLKNMPADPFLNPVIHTVQTEKATIYDLIARGSEEMEAPLDEILRIKAVQEVAPSDALSFLFSLKKLLHAEARTKQYSLTEKTLEELDTRIETFILKGFDIYMGCREQLFQIKLDEFKRNNYEGFDETMSCSSKTVESARVDVELYQK